MSPKKTTYKYLLIKFIGLLVVLLGIAQVIVANKQATSGIRVKTYDDEIIRLNIENRKLENTIAKEISYLIITKKAQKSGFITSASYVFLTKPLPVAYKR